MIEKLMKDVSYRIQAGWLKWRKALEVILTAKYLRSSKEILLYYYTTSYTIW